MNNRIAKKLKKALLLSTYNKEKIRHTNDTFRKGWQFEVQSILDSKHLDWMQPNYNWKGLNK